MCMPGILSPDVAVTITCFEAAFYAAAAEDGQDASSAGAAAGTCDGADGAAALLDLQPTQHSSLQRATGCTLEPATAQQCLAIASLSLAVLARCLRLRPATGPAAEEAEFLGYVIAELLQHGNEEAQVQPM